MTKKVQTAVLDHFLVMNCGCVVCEAVRDLLAEALADDGQKTEQAAKDARLRVAVSKITKEDMENPDLVGGLIAEALAGRP